MNKFINKAQRDIDYFNLTGLTGTEDNIGGLTTTAYYAPISYFNVIQDTEESLTSFTAYDKLAKVTATHTFLTGKGFHTLYNTANSGMVEYAQQGERDGYSLKSTAKFFYPGMKEDFLGWSRQVKNDKFIFLFVMTDNRVIQLGTRGVPAYIRIDKGGTSTMEGGRRGFEFIVEEPVTSGAKIYTATITPHP